MSLPFRPAVWLAAIVLCLLAATGAAQAHDVVAGEKPGSELAVADTADSESCHNGGSGAICPALSVANLAAGPDVWLAATTSNWPVRQNAWQAGLTKPPPIPPPMS